MIEVLQFFLALVAATPMVCSNNVDYASTSNDIELTSIPTYTFVSNEPVYDRSKNVKLFGQLVDEYYNQPNYPGHEQSGDYKFVFKISLMSAAKNRSFKYANLLVVCSFKILTRGTTNDTLVYNLLVQGFRAMADGLSRRSIQVPEIDSHLDALIHIGPNDVYGYLIMIKRSLYKQIQNVSTSPSDPNLPNTSVPTEELFHSLQPTGNLLDIFQQTSQDTQHLHNILQDIVHRINDEY